MVVSTSSPRLQRLAGIARDRDFFRVAAGGFRDPAPDRFHLALQHVDHGVPGAHVAVVQITAHRILPHDRRRADVSVVQVDDIAVDREGAPDFRPEVFIGRNLFGRVIFNGPPRSRESVDHSGNGGGSGRQLEEESTVHRLSPFSSSLLARRIARSGGDWNWCVRYGRVGATLNFLWLAIWRKLCSTTPQKQRVE